jgi:hypothetical protein
MRMNDDQKSDLQCRASGLVVELNKRGGRDGGTSVVTVGVG